VRPPMRYKFLPCAIKDALASEKGISGSWLHFGSISFRSRLKNNLEELLFASPPAAYMVFSMLATATFVRGTGRSGRDLMITLLSVLFQFSKKVFFEMPASFSPPTYMIPFSVEVTPQ